jgi:hypothetical protein
MARMNSSPFGGRAPKRKTTFAAVVEVVSNNNRYYVGC